MTLAKLLDEEICIETLKPSKRSLFQTIQRLLKTINMIGKTRINETWRLSHENWFVKNPIEKGILDINLMQ